MSWNVSSAMNTMYAGYEGKRLSKGIKDSENVKAEPL
jgi:hypothetical protein